MADRSKHSSFRFRQFEVSQDRCAMKVGTDGVLLGAWAPIHNASNAFDIGCGTGLIALMLAQRSANINTHIFAIEIDQEAAGQAKDNIDHSPWHSRIELICTDVLQYAAPMPQMDLIVSNPPYFANSLSAPDVARNQARHESTLGYETLIRIASEKLTPSGRLCMISPVGRADDILWYSELYKLPVALRIDISTIEGKRPSRILWMLTHQFTTTEYQSEYIKDLQGNFSPWFHKLTKDFYL